MRDTDELESESLADAIAANGPRLHALAFRLLGDHHAADDAVQEAFLRALRSVGRFRGDASMATWLYAITSNVCLDECRRRRRRPVLVRESDDVGREAVTDDFAQASVDRAGLAAALAGLPASQRNAVMLVEVLGLDYAEAGARLGVSRGTIGSRLHRAKQAIRQVLDASGEPASSGAPLLGEAA